MAGTKLQTHCSQPFPDGTCRLLLIGKTGSGKSATGNTIAGKTVFKTKAGMYSETKDGQFHHVERNNLRIQIMDTPGLADTDGEDKILAEKIKKAMFVMHPGPHAMLLVLRCDQRFTEEEYNVYLALKDIFGANLSSFMIIVFTGIDVLEKEELHFEDQIRDKSKFRSLHLILDDIGGRYILFNNKATKEKKERQVDKLIEKVRELVQANGCNYFKHSFCSFLEEPVRLMMAEELRLIKEKIKSTDVSSRVLCTMSSQSSGSSENPCTKSQKYIKVPGNRAPENRKEFNDEKIKTLLPPTLNRPVSEVPNVYTENHVSLETEHGNIPKSDHNVKINVKEMVNNFEVKYSDHNASNSDKPLSRFVRFPTGKSKMYGELPVQMVSPRVHEDSTSHVFPETDQHSMERPESCNPEDAEKSSVKELNFIDDETYISEEELVQTFLHAIGAGHQDLECTTKEEMEKRAVTGVWQQDLECTTKEEMEKRPVTGVWQQALECTTKEEMEKRAVTGIWQQDLEYTTKQRMEKKAVSDVWQQDLECTTKQRMENKEEMEKRAVTGVWQQDLECTTKQRMENKEEMEKRAVTVAWQQDIEIQFEDDMDDDTRYLGEVSLKQKLVDHPDQLSTLQLQQYDTTARGLECAIKEGMEKRAVKKKHKCSLM